MAQFTLTDFVIKNEFFHSGVTETLRQNVAAFNGNSGNAIVLRDMFRLGETSSETFFNLIPNLIQERDPSVTTGVADTEILQNENLSVKLNRRLGPMKGTLDQFKKIGKDPDEFSYVIGQQAGAAIAKDYLDTAIAAMTGAMANVAGVYHDATGGGTVNHSAMIAAMSKRGDRATEMSLWVMHSKAYYDLVDQQFQDKICDTSGAAIMTGTPVTLGRPVLVTDSPSLINGANYYSLLLAPGAATVEESEGRSMVAQPILAEENLAQRIQGEHAFNMGLRGFTWDVGAGGINPNAAAIALGTNWAQTATDIKDLGGVVLETL